MTERIGWAGPGVPAHLIASITYKAGWSFRLGGPRNGMLCISARTPDSHHPERERVTQHMFELPAPCDRRELIRWIFDRILLAEQHEAGEFFAVAKHRPYYPNHQDEGSPYELVERPEAPPWD